VRVQNACVPHDFHLNDILAASQRLGDRVRRTPLLDSAMLDARAGCRLLVKADSLQRTGSFKFRGALNKLLALDPQARERGVLAFSSGNHGHAVAAAARMLGCPAVIVLPDTAPQVKVDNCRWWGAEIVLYDPHRQDREVVGRELAQPRGLTLVPPFDDLDIMAGQGTCGLEICEQLSGLAVVPDAVLVACSGGGLASGVFTAVKAHHPQARCIVVEPVGGEKMARSLAVGTPQRNASVPATLMDAIIGPVAGAKPLEVLRRLGTDALQVSDEQVLPAMATLFDTLKLAVEPGGAAPLAAVLSNPREFAGKSVVVVCSGGNVDDHVFTRALASRDLARS